MQNWQATLASQFANSPAIVSLLDSFNTAVDPSADIDRFFTLVRSIDTAQGAGLDVWGRILGVTRVLELPGTAVGPFFGFNGQGAQAKNFGASPFFPGQPPASSYALSDDAYRTLLLVKARSNISERSIPALNNALKVLFPANTGRVVDNLDMTCWFLFAPILTPLQVAILKQSGVLPGPSGVTVLIRDPSGFR